MHKVWCKVCKKPDLKYNSYYSVSLSREIFHFFMVCLHKIQNHLHQKSLKICFRSQIIINITARTSAMWISAPRLKTKRPIAHNIKRIMPIINNMHIHPPFSRAARQSGFCLGLVTTSNPAPFRYGRLHVYIV
jgi:hypothetical protein